MSAAMELVLRDIAAERRGQTSREGWTDEHDDEHDDGEIARAAAMYALPADARAPSWLGRDCPALWPWDGSWWKPSPDDRRKELVKAGALILAEIERLDRAERGVTDGS